MIFAIKPSGNCGGAVVASVRLRSHHVIDQLVKRLGRQAGIEISRYRPFAARRVQLLRANGISTVIDVGANTGGYGSDLRAFGYSGRIISLEPLAGAFAELARRVSTDPRWECQRVAAGERDGEATINVASKSGSSSLLAMREEHRRGAPDVFTTGQERIRLRRLDSLDLDVQSPAILKIDTQGYEDRVLEGATKTLTSIALLECELSIARLYDGQPSFRKMIDLLSDLGFELYDVDPFFYERPGGRVLATDAMFVRGE
jgi:FkbM family methyltransferase